MLASGSNDQIVRLWDITNLMSSTDDAALATNRSVKTLSGHTNWVRAVAFSPDGQTLASGSADQTVRLWDVANIYMLCLKTLVGHTSWVASVAFSPDGQVLASGSHDGTVRLWNAANMHMLDTGQCLKSLTGHTNSVYSIAFNPNGQTPGEWQCGSNSALVGCRYWPMPSKA